MQNKKLLIYAGGGIAIIAIGILIYFLVGSKSPIKIYSVEAKTGDITEKINLAGQVKASQGVDLAFESQGKIVANYVKVGDNVYAGQALAAVDSGILQAQLQVAQAQLDSLNLNVVANKNGAAMQSAYSSALASNQKSVSNAKQAFLSILNIPSISTNGSLQNMKGAVVESLLGQGNAGFWQTWQIANLNGGAFGLAQDATSNPTQTNADTALSATLKALQDLNYLINNLPADPSLPAADANSIAQQKSVVNSEIISTSANIQAISSLKVNNSATVTTTDSQIEVAKAGVNVIKSQIAKTVLTSPVAGKVAKDDITVGAMSSANAPVITISNDNLEIDTNIPEIDLPEAKVGGTANITLDAFGTSQIFPATIVSIDLAPSTVNGVSVYGAKLKFVNNDGRIMPGMTANITLISQTHTNAITVPKSAVIKNNGQYFVVLDNGNGNRQSQAVSIGLHDDNNIEILSGLKAGEKVLAY